jgi:hypothetical protein
MYTGLSIGGGGGVECITRGNAPSAVIVSVMLSSHPPFR